MIAGAEDFARIAYIGDVPARALTAGPAVLYRMFECLPPGRLLLGEDLGAGRDLPGQPPPGARLTAYRLVRERWLRSRFRDLAGSWFFARAAAPAASLAREVRAFGAEAIVSMAHGYGWWTAHAVARRLGLRFHLLAHDWWGDTMPVHRGLRAAADRRFGLAYRAAASRLVVSPGMEEEYRRLYGAPGTVLYPIRSPRLVHASTLPAPASGRPFTFGFAGDAGTPWARGMLARFANVLAPRGARLRIHYSVDAAVLRAAGATADNIDIVPFDPDPALLQSRLVAGVDALYLPMSFAPADRRNVSLCFPSKAADYTATGRPVLIHAPAFSSAVRWALAHPDAGLVVDRPGPEPLAEAVDRLLAEPALRAALAGGAGRAGHACFAPEAVMAAFAAAVRA